MNARSDVGSNRDRVNANFCVYYAQKSSRTHNHGSDAYSVVTQEAGLGLDTSQTTHEAINNHGRHTSIVKGRVGKRLRTTF